VGFHPVGGPGCSVPIVAARPPARTLLGVPDQEPRDPHEARAEPFEVHPDPLGPRPDPLDPPMVPFALAGTGIWAAVGLVLLATGAPTTWLWTCLAGFGLGLGLLVLMVVRDRRRRGGRAT
jgi:hypothetical protein